jgi:hypothetical protein
MPHRPVRSFSAPRLAVAAACLAAALAATGRAAAADEVVKLAADQAAIIFLIDGQGRGGDLQVRDRQGQAVVWGSVLSPASVLQFTVNPGAYVVLLAPNQQAIPLAAVAGHATVISLTGTGPDGAYRWQSQSEVAPAEIDQTAVPGFIDDKRIAPSGYAPTSLSGRGAGLTFVFRTNL